MMLKLSPEKAKYKQKEPYLQGRFNHMERRDQIGDLQNKNKRTQK